MLKYILIILELKNILGRIITKSHWRIVVTCLILIGLFIAIHILRNGLLDFLKANTFNRIDELLVSLDVSFLICLILGHYLLLSC